MTDGMNMPGSQLTGDDVKRLLDQCRQKPRIYKEREVEFLRSVGKSASLTAAQGAWLTDLAEREPIDFATVNQSALMVLSAICKRWMPDGVVYGKEFVARNPTRADGNPGSFRINIQTGQWADFATDDKGGDPISLAAYLHCGGDQVEAARALKRMLGL